MLEGGEQKGPGAITRLRDLLQSDFCNLTFAGSYLMCSISR